MNTCYLAKEPGLGVRDDLSISGEVTIVDCLKGINDYNCTGIETRL